MGRKFTVLTIDDEPDLIQYYRDVLDHTMADEYAQELASIHQLSLKDLPEITENRELFELLTASSGEAGLEIVKEQARLGTPVSVLFCDMRMPGGWDGLETAARIRQLDPHISIIFVTALMDYSLSEIRQRIGENFTFLTKPLQSDELYQVAISAAITWEQLAEMRRINQSKDHYLASVSHELRTPLSAIIGNVELVVEEIGDRFDASHFKMLQDTLAAARSQLALVNDILDISKMESGKFEIDEYPYDLNEMVSGVKSLFSIKAKSHGITFAVERGYQPENLLIGDQQRIHQILVNLLSNAIKFTEQGTVRLAINKRGERLLFEVEDSGIGIEESAIQKLFSPFTQANKSISNRFGGTGLGLNISQSLAEQMGGTIHVSSVLGEGTCFTLDLPLHESDEAVVIREEEEWEPYLSSLQFSGHVLLVEDTKELQVMVAHMLKNTGLTVEVADDGSEAVEKGLAGQYDLILMDMRMPVMDGVEATRLLRGMGVDVPIIALTANVMSEHKSAFIKAGASGFIKKPIDRVGFITTLSEHLTLVDTDEEAPPQRESEPLISNDLKKVFLEQLRHHSSVLFEALEQDDLEKMMEIGHKMKGCATTFGFDEAAQTGIVLCKAYRADQQGQVRDAAQALLQQMKQHLA